MHRSIITRIGAIVLFVTVASRICPRERTSPDETRPSARRKIEADWLRQEEVRGAGRCRARRPT